MYHGKTWRGTSPTSSSLPLRIAGMRDKLIHGYFGVDIDAVWDTVKRDIPELKDEIKRIIDEIEQ